MEILLIETILVETYGPFLQVEDILMPGECSVSIIGAIKTAVVGSAFIEMPNMDFGGVEGTVVFWDSSIDEGTCISAFPRVFLANGEAGPQDDTVLPTLRTGPDRSLIGITGTEIFNDDITDTGELLDPLTENKVMQWDGAAWISYVPNADCVIV